MIEQDDKIPTLHEIYPTATEDELIAIDFVMREHIRIVMDMYERIAADPVAHADLVAALTKKRKRVG